MESLNLACTIDKLFLIASALDSLLIDNYTLLLHESGAACRSLLNTVCTGVSELRRDLETLAMSDPLYLATDGLERSFPIDNAADSGYDNHEKQA